MTKKKIEQHIINIKKLSVKGHIGSSKYIHGDWGTIAYAIPRSELKKEFEDKELQHNGLYFLIGYENNNEMVYVGQAKKRNSGGSILKRLREHDESTTEKYRDIWEWAVAVTHKIPKYKEDEWTLDDLNALENAFYQEIPQQYRLNGNTPNSAGADYTIYTEKIKQIKELINAIGFNIFADFEDEKEIIQITEELHENTPVEDLHGKMERIPEIITPQRVVKQMVDMLPDDVWNPNTKFLDLACKGGEYLREIYNRLMETESLKILYEDSIDRSNYILRKQIFGISLTSVSFERTVKKLHGEDRNIKLISNYLDKDIGIICKNIKQRQKNIDRIFKDVFAETFKKEWGTEEVKFDVVIGNPPYNEKKGGGNNDSGATSLFDKFITTGIHMSDKLVCMITPSKWMSGNQSNFVQLRQKLVADNHIAKMVDYFNPVHVFPGTQIAGGVSYFLFDKEYDGQVEFTHRIKTKDKNIDVTDYRTFNTDGIIVRHAVAESVLNKMKDIEGNYKVLSAYVYKNLWKLPTDFRDGSVVPTAENNIKVITPEDNYYISREDVENIYINTYKVMFTRVVNGSTFLIDSSKSILSSLRVIEPNEICNASYMVIPGINKREYAENIKSYLETKFVRFLILQTLFGIGLTADRFQFVPMQDFTHTWTDAELYRKYNLTDEEINFIEAIIAPITSNPPEQQQSKPKPKLTLQDMEANMINKLIQESK